MANSKKNEGPNIIKRIWIGDISLGWAFWGVGLGGLLFPFIAILSTMVGFVSISILIQNIKAVPLPMRFFALEFAGGSWIFFLCAGISLVFIFLIPAVVIWRSASNSISKLWRRLAKGYVVISGIASFVVVPPMFFLLMFIEHMDRALTPEFYENTAELNAEAPALFKNHTGIEIPEGAKIIHTAYFRRPVMDYEFGSHIVIDASAIDLRSWLETTHPFGVSIAKQVPERGLEWDSEGLICTPRFEAICKFVASPRSIWHHKKRLDIDHVVTLTVMEKEKLIWLYETSW